MTVTKRKYMKIYFSELELVWV